MLIVGEGSISLYAVLWAKALGAAEITFANPAAKALEVGADVVGTRGDLARCSVLRRPVESASQKQSLSR